VTRERRKRRAAARSVSEGRAVAPHEPRRGTASPLLLMGGLLAVVILLGGMLLAMLRSSPPSTAQAATPAPTLSRVVAGATNVPEPTPVPAVAESFDEREQVQRISVAQAKALVDSGQAALYDTRPPDAFLEKHAAGANSFPEDSLEALLPTLPPDKTLIFYCT
jgi:hypothetical protein